MTNSELPKYNFNFSPETKQIRVDACVLDKPVTYTSRFYWNFNSYIGALFKHPSPRLADLAEMASSIFLADRLARRGKKWKRNLNLCIPVRDLVFWEQPNISRTLSDILYYLTEDYWTFEFTNRKRTALDNQKQIDFPFDMPNETCIALFSGGLDSFAGVVKHLNDSKYKKSYLISIVTNHRMRGVQKKLAQSIRNELNIDLIYVPLVVFLRSPKPPELLQENTQRTRGFIFTVLGSIFSVLAGKYNLSLFENGVGAINLPMVNFQIGTDNTRSVNPTTLIEISKFMSLVIGDSFEIKNHAQWLTKAELCRALSESVLKDSIKKTVSCDGGFSRRIKGLAHCGLCTSCILRRQALFAAGLSGDDTNYQFDFFQTKSIRDKNRLLGFKAMKSQVLKIERCLSSRNPWFELSRNFPLLEEVRMEISNLSERKMVVIKDKILRLYSNYINEWQLLEQRLN